MKVYSYRALFPDLEYNLGLAYYYKNDFSSSVRHFENFLRIHPTNTSIYHETAMVLYMSERWQDIVELCERAEEWRVKRPPYRYWAEALLHLGEVVKAHQKITIALAGDKETPALWVTLGDVLSKAGYYQQAKEVYAIAEERMRTKSDGATEVQKKIAKVEELMQTQKEVVVNLGPNPVPPKDNVLEKPRNSMCDLGGCSQF